MKYATKDELEEMRNQATASIVRLDERLDALERGKINPDKLYHTHTPYVMGQMNEDDTEVLPETQTPVEYITSALINAFPHKIDTVTVEPNTKDGKHVGRGMKVTFVVSK